MKIQTNYLTILGGLISLLLSMQLTGCATAGKDSLPQGGDMTMAQIYQQEAGLSANSDYSAGDQDVTQVRQRLRTSGFRQVDYTAYSVPSDNSTRQLFKPLSNPEVPMYIYPHLVQSNDNSQPVPGYTTAFFLYKENYFALPSEDY